MTDFNILDYVTVITVTGQERLDFCNEHYGNGVISNTQLTTDDVLVVIEYGIAFPPVLARVHNWLADGNVSLEEISEIWTSDEDIALKIPTLVGHPERVAEYRQSILDTYRARFNRLNPNIWSYIDKPLDTMDDIRPPAQPIEELHHGLAEEDVALVVVRITLDAGPTEVTRVLDGEDRNSGRAGNFVHGRR